MLPAAHPSLMNLFLQSVIPNPELIIEKTETDCGVDVEQATSPSHLKKTKVRRMGYAEARAPGRHVGDFNMCDESVANSTEKGL